MLLTKLLPLTGIDNGVLSFVFQHKRTSHGCTVSGTRSPPNGAKKKSGRKVGEET